MLRARRRLPRSSASAVLLHTIEPHVARVRAVDPGPPLCVAVPLADLLHGGFPANELRAAGYPQVRRGSVIPVHTPYTGQNGDPCSQHTLLEAELQPSSTVHRPRFGPSSLQQSACERRRPAMNSCRMRRGRLRPRHLQAISTTTCFAMRQWPHCSAHKERSQN